MADKDAKAKRKAGLEKERRDLEKQLPTDKTIQTLRERIAQGGSAALGARESLQRALNLQARIDTIDNQINSIDEGKT
jgi:hypothetical protein